MMSKMLSQEELEEIEFVKKLKSNLEKETDRGCCLLAVSFLDNEMELLLSNKLLGSLNHKKTLFNFNGPLGTFSSKISLGFSLGLISENLKIDIHQIRKIRNDFAHNYEHIDFNTTKIKNSILQLKHNLYKNDDISIREMFINSITIMLAEISSTKAIHPKFVEKKNPQYLEVENLREYVKLVNLKVYDTSQKTILDDTNNDC